MNFLNIKKLSLINHDLFLFFLKLRNFSIGDILTSKYNATKNIKQ